MSDGNGGPPPTPPPHPSAFEYDAWVLSQSDPWVIIAAVKQLDIARRPAYLGLFQALTAGKPVLERESLAEAGKEVWHYRIGTFRDEIKKAARGREQDALVIEQPCVVGDTWMADMIYRRGQNPPVQYVVYEFATGKLTLAKEVTIPPATYQPPYTDILDSTIGDVGTLVLPSGVEEYGEDEDLLAAIRQYLLRYVAFADRDDPFIWVVVYYVVMTWVYDRFSVIPYLRALGDFSAGKSRLIRTAGAICYRSLLTVGATTAAPIFRIITKFQPTLVLDEMDLRTRSEVNDDMLKILLVGYERGGAVLRAERSPDSPEFGVRAYECFSPKIMATRRPFDDPAIESRCLTRTMPAIEVPDTIPLSLEREFYRDSATLRNKLLLWRLRHWEDVEVNPYQRFKGVEVRVNQIIQPLLSCFPQASQERITAVIHDLSRLTTRERAESTEGAIALALLTEWKRSNCPDRLLMKRVYEHARDELGEDKVTAKSVGTTVRQVLGLPTDKVGGMTWVFFPPEVVSLTVPRIMRAYSINLDGAS